MTTTNPTTDSIAAGVPPAGDDEVIVARAGRYYRNTRYLFVLAMILFGAYFAYDGWVAWPREAQMNRQNPKTGKPHTDTDIWFQKVLAGVLPPLGLAFLGWTLYRSRGAFRLRGDVLGVPGHGDVSLDSVRQIDKSKWDRKGIASIEYEPRAGATRSFVLDDFVYDRPPIDRILERIEEHVAKGAETTGGEEKAGG